MAIDDMVDRLGLPKPDHPAFQTAAGFVLNELGYLPALGESFEAHGWRFEVIDLDGRRIDKILASKLPVSGRRPRFGER
jgi:putative hemolysin